MKKLVSILLVNHNNNHYTIDCLKSLCEQTYQHFEVIIVDNGSEYNTYLDLKRKIKDFEDNLNIILIRSNYKLYFAAGTNKGLKVAKGDYICLLNNDTEVLSDFLEKPIAYLEKNENVGMLCTKILFFYDKNRIWYAGGYLNPRSIYFSYHIGLNQKDNGKYDEIKETDFTNGAALFTTRKVIEEIGLLDEVFFMYAEDSDWSFRAKEKGYKLIYFPETVVYHKVNPITKETRSGYRENPFQVYLYTRNKIIFTFKFYSLISIILFFYIYQLRATFIEILLSLRQRNPKFLTAQFRALIMGTLIGLRRKTHRNCRKIMKKEYKYINKFQKYRS
ncbi:MAG: glycosyltransferase family 2 protein [Candidatus Hodarchaeota archaeon]